ncbi:hypothetical protein CFC21_043081 [Triticum aestivum]|uniref:Uncharacterized protein n=2 Tax=Triticum aestivum TaxID=4565 RepID=A0A3B6FWR9_WHEAT|nr:hypothetical protein CFC21_043081 [Triticum aestivum]
MESGRPLPSSDPRDGRGGWRAALFIVEPGNADGLIHAANATTSSRGLPWHNYHLLATALDISVTCSARLLLHRTLPASASAGFPQAVLGGHGCRPVQFQRGRVPELLLQLVPLLYLVGLCHRGDRGHLRGRECQLDRRVWCVLGHHGGVPHCLLARQGTYRVEQPVDGSSFGRLTEKFVFSRTGATIDTQRLLETNQDGFLVKLLPIWVSSIVFAACISQITTLFTKQGSTMDRRLGGAAGLVVPPAALQCCISFTFIVLVPIYDRAIVPFVRHLTGHPGGITMLQRIGAGMVTTCINMVVAALVETKRLRVTKDAGLLDQPDVAVPMSLCWLVPQYVLICLAEVFSYIGLEEFFYNQVPDALRSVGLALCLGIFGAGSYASGMLVWAIDWATTRGGRDSWFSDNLNRAHLDYFYWILAGLGALEVVVFLYFAKQYVYRNKPDQ